MWQAENYLGSHAHPLLWHCGHVSCQPLRGYFRRLWHVFIRVWTQNSTSFQNHKWVHKNQTDVRKVNYERFEHKRETTLAVYSTCLESIVLDKYFLYSRYYKLILNQWFGNVICLSNTFWSYSHKFITLWHHVKLYSSLWVPSLFIGVITLKYIVSLFLKGLLQFSFCSFTSSPSFSSCEFGVQSILFKWKIA